MNISKVSRNPFNFLVLASPDTLNLVKSSFSSIGNICFPNIILFENKIYGIVNSKIVEYDFSSEKVTVFDIKLEEEEFKYPNSISIFNYHKKKYLLLTDINGDIILFDLKLKAVKKHIKTGSFFISIPIFLSNGKICIMNQSRELLLIDLNQNKMIKTNRYVMDLNKMMKNKIHININGEFIVPGFGEIDVLFCDNDFFYNKNKICLASDKIPDIIYYDNFYLFFDGKDLIKYDQEFSNKSIIYENNVNINSILLVSNDFLFVMGEDNNFIIFDKEFNIIKKGELPQIPLSIYKIDDKFFFIYDENGYITFDILGDTQRQIMNTNISGRSFNLYIYNNTLYISFYNLEHQMCLLSYNLK